MYDTEKVRAFANGMVEYGCSVIDGSSLADDYSDSKRATAVRITDTNILGRPIPMNPDHARNRT